MSPWDNADSCECLGLGQVEGLGWVNYEVGKKKGQMCSFACGHAHTNTFLGELLFMFSF